MDFQSSAIKEKLSTNECVNLPSQTTSNLFYLPGLENLAFDLVPLDNQEINYTSEIYAVQCYKTSVVAIIFFKQILINLLNEVNYMQNNYI